jgi:WD40 repeat protein
VYAITAFNTTSDGHPLLATGSDDGTAQIWDPMADEMLQIHLAATTRKP